MTDIVYRHWEPHPGEIVLCSLCFDAAGTPLYADTVPQAVAGINDDGDEA